MKSLMKTILDGDWADLKTDIETKTATMIKTKVDEKKTDILSKLNGVSKEQMEEVLAVTNDVK